MRQIVAILTITLMAMMAAMVVIIVGSVQQSEQLISYANELQENKTILKQQTLQATIYQEQAKEYEMLLKQSEADCQSLTLQLSDALAVVESLSTIKETAENTQMVLSTDIDEGDDNVLQTSITLLEAQRDELSDRYDALLVDYETLQETLQTLMQQQEQTTVSIDDQQVKEWVQMWISWLIEHWPRQTITSNETYEVVTTAPTISPTRTPIPIPKN